jgi:uncharacterized protein (DUF488 family)
MPVLWTIGHSTRPLEGLISALKAHEIELLADVRAYPASRRHPDLARSSLEKALPPAGIEYLWLGRELGGRRKPLEESPNRALRSPGFRGYADYMGTEAFSGAMEALLGLAARRRVAVMCAELLWWKCHRSLIADYAQLAKGWEVRHLKDEGPPLPHRPKKEARLDEGRLVYGEPELF